MTDVLRLPIPEPLTAEFVVVDPRTTVDLAAPDGRPDDLRIEWIGSDHVALRAPELLAGGGADPQSLSRVYEAGRHLLVSVVVPGAVGPLGATVAPSASTVAPSASAAGPVTAHVDRARAAAGRLAGRTGGLLLDPALARLIDLEPADLEPADPQTGPQSGPQSGPQDVADRDLRWERHLRIGATGAPGSTAPGSTGAPGPAGSGGSAGSAGAGTGLTMFTLGLTRLGLPELRTVGLAPFLGPAWARLMQAVALRLLTRPPGRPARGAGPESDHDDRIWLLSDEIQVSEVNGGMAPAAGVDAPGTETGLGLGLRLDPAAPRPRLLVVPPREFTGTEAEWRIELVNRVFPAARI